MKIHASTLNFLLFFLLFYLSAEAQIYKVEPLNNGINTPKYDEISPVVSIDGKTIFFTRSAYPLFDKTLKLEGENIAAKLNKNDYNKKLAEIFSEISGKKVHDAQRSSFNQDIWMARTVFDDFELIVHPKYPLNNALPNSVCAITPNGNELVVINRFSKFGGLQKGFSVCRKGADKKWSFPEPIEIKNYSNVNSDVNLAMSSDGNTMVLSMQGKDSYGKNDLYICFKTGLNEWSEPRNLGSKINTPYKEITPFVSADGKKIFFASNRPGTLGGNDIFYVEKIGEGWDNWTAPIRFVEPINSDSDDSQPYFNSATGYIYFASNRNGSMDIFRSQLMPPNPIFVTIKGRIINSQTGSLESAKVLYSPTDKEHLKNVYVSDDGTFELIVQKGKEFELIAEKSGFSGKKDTIAFRSDYAYFKPHPMDLYLDPMAVNAKIELAPIFFEQSKAVVLEDSYAVLDDLAEFLKENWTISIRIEGHTDNQGDKKALQKLSEDRAEAIKEYLVFKKFIQPLRIETVGMGAKQPINGNTNEKLRAKNRRVEVVITKINDISGGLETRR